MRRAVDGAVNVVRLDVERVLGDALHLDSKRAEDGEPQEGEEAR